MSSGFRFITSHLGLGHIVSLDDDRPRSKKKSRTIELLSRVTHVLRLPNSQVPVKRPPSFLAH
ncbi:Uncharacterized protein APZ42_030540 [Daphnia magna]|uniref:Uncharacterized protein n=1 Tax=Daphnia magna TaxID=35525 RepID=A0A0N8CT54_9CRUS|nr:Uncharacterized protein APZ42_030540 [Daphnia magna]